MTRSGSRYIINTGLVFTFKVFSRFLPVFLCGGENLFVGADDAFLPFFEADAGDDAAAHAGFAVEAEIMLVEIDGGGLFRYQDSLFSHPVRVARVRVYLLLAGESPGMFWHLPGG